MREKLNYPLSREVVEAPAAAAAGACDSCDSHHSHSSAIPHPHHHPLLAPPYILLFLTPKKKQKPIFPAIKRRSGLVLFFREIYCAYIFLDIFNRYCMMGSDDQLGYDPSPTPKLALFSFSGKLHESPAGMLTPPIHTLASVPFKWEEAPGKPRPSCITRQSKPKFARCLELPPRLLNEVKVSNSPSPSTVLDGPYVSRSLSLGKGSSRSSLENLGGGKVSSKDSRVVFGSSRWGGFWKNNKEFDDPGPGDSSGVSHGGETKVKITRIRRRSSFLGLSHSRSHFWTDIYESFKHAVPWTRR